MRSWWRALYGSDADLDTEHLMRLAGRFSRRVHAYAHQHGLPLLHWAALDNQPHTPCRSWPSNTSPKTPTSPACSSFSSAKARPWSGRSNAAAARAPLGAQDALAARLPLSLSLHGQRLGPSHPQDESRPVRGFFGLDD